MMPLAVRINSGYHVYSYQRLLSISTAVMSVPQRDIKPQAKCPENSRLLGIQVPIGKRTRTSYKTIVRAMSCIQEHSLSNLLTKT